MFKINYKKCINCKFIAELLFFIYVQVFNMIKENWKLSLNSPPAQISQIHCCAVVDSIHLGCKVTGRVTWTHVHYFVGFWSGLKIRWNIAHRPCYSAFECWWLHMLLFIGWGFSISAFFCPFLWLFCLLFWLFNGSFWIFYSRLNADLEHLFAFLTLPVSFGKNIMQTGITVNMTTVKFTNVTDQKHIFIISIATFITNVPVKFTEFKHFFFHFNDFSLFLHILLIDNDLYIFSEILTTARTASWWLDPLLNALITEFMATSQLPPNVWVLIEANCTQILESWVAVIFGFNLHQARF
jgi:hypothetical protein